jgi:hypothetical protein
LWNRSTHGKPSRDAEKYADTLQLSAYTAQNLRLAQPSTRSKKTRDRGNKGTRDRGNKGTRDRGNKGTSTAGLPTGCSAGLLTRTSESSASLPGSSDSARARKTSLAKTSARVDHASASP